jgi:hypothetical protein
MPSVFDGMAGILTDVLGDPVTYIPAGGVPRSVPSVFRREPINITDPDGREVLIMAPTWRVQRDLAPEARRGDRILAPDGLTYDLVNVQPTGSPAADSFLLCELERIFP